MTELELLRKVRDGEWIPTAIGYKPLRREGLAFIGPAGAPNLTVKGQERLDELTQASGEVAPA